MSEKLYMQLLEVKGLVESLRAENQQLRERVKFLEEMLRGKLSPEQSTGKG
jgi:hypothetical protein